MVSITARAQFTVTIKWLQAGHLNNSDTLYYNTDKKLTWADFKGRPDAASPAAAVTESGFGYRLNMNGGNNRIEVIVTVFCYFDKKKSWVKKDMDTEYALTHEQHHYDITYINACRFINKLKQTTFSRNNYSRLVEKIYNEHTESLGNMQDAYDGQTANGRIKKQQLAWNKKIEDELAALATH
ncbi:MAG: hypothetical protein KF825_07015 [Ferruginibacter sp.]|nr:hypothetical protein [Ferruginibacter sp.]